MHQMMVELKILDDFQDDWLYLIKMPGHLHFFTRHSK